MTAKGFFITGTDTGVGKTHITAALLQFFISQGKTAVGMKPIAAGCDETSLICEDVEILQGASNVEAPQDWINPYGFIPPIAPHIAARQAGVTIDLNVIAHAYDGLAKLADVVVVEGVGGFRVPLNDSQDTADLAGRLDLPVILVVGMRLGCINHALLTAEAIQGRGLKLAGWVANSVLPEMSALNDNIEALEQRINAPLLGIIPFAEDPPSQICHYLDFAINPYFGKGLL